MIEAETRRHTVKIIRPRSTLKVLQSVACNAPINVKQAGGGGGEAGHGVGF